LAIAGLVLGVIATVLTTIVLSVFAIVALGASADERFGDVGPAIDGGVNSDLVDGYCNYDRYMQDPDC
jgi:hypothetical protein